MTQHGGNATFTQRLVHSTSIAQFHWQGCLLPEGALPGWDDPGSVRTRGYIAPFRWEGRAVADSISMRTERRFYLAVNADPMMDNVKKAQDIRDNDINSYAKFYEGGKDNKHFLALTSDMQEALLDMHSFLQHQELTGLEQW